MECRDAATAEPRYLICAVGRDGTDFRFTPFSLSPTAIPSTPICYYRSNLTHRPPDPELLACLSAAVRGSTGKPFPHLRCVTHER
jgi:hypothetical protein